MGALLLAPAVQAQSVEIDSIGMSGTRMYRPGYWSEMQAVLSNPTDADAHPLLAVSIDEMNQVQFATRPWLAPRSARRVRLPIKLMVNVPADQRAWTTRPQLITERGRGSEQAVDTDITLVQVFHDRISTAMMVSADSENRDNAARRIVRLLRGMDSTLSPGTASLNQRDAPDHPAGLDAVDCLMIALNDPQLDAAQQQTLRQWVLDGGRLWLMLDQTPPELGAQLFGDHWTLTALDLVELNDLTIRRDGSDDPGERRQFDYPVRMRRVITDDSMWETVHTVEGYPASLRRSVGHGEVYVTTLGAKAWMLDPDTPGESLSGLRPWLRPSQERLERYAVQQQAYSAFVQQQIGYRILSLPPVTTVLAIYLIGLALCGFWLMRRDRLERLGLVGVVLSVAVTLALVVLGLARQTQTPTTLAVAQVGHYFDRQPYVALNDRISIYRSPLDEGGQLLLRGEGGLAWPSLAAQGGQIMRYTTQRPDRWRMEQLNLPPGAVTDVRLTQVRPLQRAAAAVLGWNAQGRIVGRLDGDGPATLEDAVIASRDAHMAVQFDGGDLRSGTESMLDNDQFISAVVLSQSQEARQQVYRALFDDPRFAARPSLVGWTAARDQTLQLGESVERRSAGLFSLPLRFERPAAGSRLELPMPLLEMQVLRGVPNVTPPSVFDERTREFVPNVAQESDLVMRFTVPEALRPLTLEQVRLDFDITALGREVSVVVYRDQQIQVVQTFSSPTQPQSVTIRGADLPSLTDGWFGAGLRVAPAPPGQSSQWTPRKIHAHAIAITGDRE